VGAIPRQISTPTGLVGFVSASAKSPAAARDLLKLLSSRDADDVYRAVGMVPQNGRPDLRVTE
jgi:hypothetical protein